MFFLLVTLYEFGQFLRILLWISVPLIIICVLGASYLHYRKRKITGADDLLSSDSELGGDPLIEPGQTPPAGEKAYQGLLWLKRKYEEDIEQADTRYYEMREEFKKLEKKYIELRVHSISLEQQLQSMREALPGDTQRELTSLNDRLADENRKVKDLETRLESSSQLLMKMYKELAGSLQANNTFYKNKAHENRVKGLVREFDAVAASGMEERKISSWAESPSVEEDGQLEQLG